MQLQLVLFIPIPRAFCHAVMIWFLFSEWQNSLLLYFMHSIHMAADGGYFLKWQTLENVSSLIAPPWIDSVRSHSYNTNKHPRRAKKRLKLKSQNGKSPRFEMNAFKLNFIFQFYFECLGSCDARIWLSPLQKFPLLINYYIKRDVSFRFVPQVLYYFACVTTPTHNNKSAKNSNRIPHSYPWNVYKTQTENRRKDTCGNCKLQKILCHFFSAVLP